MLDASTRVASAAGSGVLDARLHEHLRFFPFLGCFVGPSCYSSIQSLVNTCLLYTGAAPVLDASARVAAAAGSGLIDLHFAFVVDHAHRSHQRALMFSVARKFTLRASGGSNTPSSYIHRSSARARRVCSSSREKRPHRSALCIRRRPCTWVASTCSHVRCCEEAHLASLGWI